MQSMSAAGSGAPSRSSSKSSSVGQVSSLHVFALLLAFRVSNALAVKTFFQPDEYFQALEPAWQIANGPKSGAWITWEWKNQLRSSLHPLIFSIPYSIVNQLTSRAQLSPKLTSELLLTVPKATQAVFAACIDFYSWKCAQSVYGHGTGGSKAAWTTLALSIVSPWQFFCSVRTFSNSLETALTAGALTSWLALSIPTLASDHKPSSRNVDSTKSTHDEPSLSAAEMTKLRISFLLAASAAILRPTNVLIWIPLGLELLWRSSSKAKIRIVLEALRCGILIASISILADLFYYGTFTFPPAKFLYFNVARDLAVFYGRNRLDYYVSEGLPLLLTTVIPFAVWGMHGILSFPASGPDQVSYADGTKLKLRSLLFAVLFTTVALTLISHKEVRFLYPLLPSLLVIAAEPVSKFFGRKTAVRNVLLVCLLGFNIVLGWYVSQVHQRGVIDVMQYLRDKHEAQILVDGPSVRTTVGFLMPCHSTPWRSHLVHRNIDGWALTCEPPLDVPLEARSTYLDEADEFYADPKSWLQDHMESHYTRRMRKGMDTKSWPDNFVFFEQLEPVIQEFLYGTVYRECWRGFNTHWHDDWRRKGDVIVWCRDR